MPKTKFHPHGDRLLVKRNDKETVTPGGIQLPDNSQKNSNTGTVIAVGAGRYLPSGDLIDVPYVPGDTVMFGQFAGTEIELDDQEYVILEADSVLGRLYDAED